MIKGYCVDKDELVFASEIDKEDKHEYKCPCCKDILIPKKGEIKTHHFSHYKENDINKHCIFKSNSMAYDEWVFSMLTAFEPKEVEVEKDGVIIDVLLGDNSITLAYIEHMMSNKGFVPILEEKFKLGDKVSNFNVLLNMSDEFTMVEKDNKLIWEDRWAIKSGLFVKELKGLNLCIYVDNIFYFVRQKDDDFSEFDIYDKIEGLENYVKYMRG